MAQHFAGLEAGDPECRLEGGAPEYARGAPASLPALSIAGFQPAPAEPAIRIQQSEIWLRPMAAQRAL
ncbi:MAG TPA: hypothetical protein VLR94_08250 [Acidobacteriota bacterium]|nr:hypothetical protein [Acidobacteriota bacterium]